MYFFAILPRGNIQPIGSIDTSDSPMVPANVLGYLQHSDN